MRSDLVLMTVYGLFFGLFLVFYTFKKKHIHHWVFGLLFIIGVIPVIIVYYFFRYDFYLLNIIFSLLIGFISFLMDYDDFIKWWRKFKKV